jgi:hypothetical protein
MNKITGMTGYDPDNGVFAWSYECVTFPSLSPCLPGSDAMLCRVHRPGDFSYKHDAKQKAVLVVANLRKQGDGDVLLRKLRTILGGIKAGEHLTNGNFESFSFNKPRQPQVKHP